MIHCAEGYSYLLLNQLYQIFRVCLALLSISIKSLHPEPESVEHLNPVAVLEMGIAGFLDGEALSFGDCQPRY